MTEREVVVTGGSPWGMRLTGGKDFGSPLMVSKVSPGSKSAFAGVQDNDYVLRINGKDTKEMMHMDAQNCIKKSGDTLRMALTQAQPKGTGVEITGTVAPTSSLAPARPTPPPAPPSTRTPPTAPPSAVTFRTAPPQPSPPNPPPQPSPPNPPPQPSPPTVTFHGGLYPAGSEPVKLVEYTPSPAGEAGLDSSQSKQSPAYNRILMADEVPFGHASAEKGAEKRTPTRPPPPPAAPTTPPTRQLQNIRIEQGNVVKTSERPGGYYPPPPPGVSARPVPVSPKSIDTSNLPKPTPPPAASVPPPSPSRVTKEGFDAGRTPPSPGGGAAKLSTRQSDCEKCKQPIRGPYAAALGKFWHPEHFTCTKCLKQLSNQTFVVEGDEPYCEPCYERSVAPMCEECKHIITGAYICAVNRFWHKEHFKCFKCKRNLGTEEGFNFEGGHLYCTGCYSDQFGVICAGCNKVIGGADLWVEALDKNWHPNCFVCESCRAPLEGGTFFVKLGRPYCGLHR